jgi:hypothetical protein
MEHKHKGDDFIVVSSATGAALLAELDALRQRVSELESVAEWARLAYKAVAFSEGVRPLGMAGLLADAPAQVTTPTPSERGKS